MMKILNSTKLKNILAHLKSKSFMPYTLISELSPRKEYSCFFVYNTKFYKTEFIAENIFSLLSENKVEVTHRLKFFDINGKFILQKNYLTYDNLIKLVLPKIYSNNLFISFIHEVFPNDPEFTKDIETKFKQIFLQHRGYTIYKKISFLWGV